jgi:hypothetical protein
VPGAAAPKFRGSGVAGFPGSAVLTAGRKR